MERRPGTLAVPAWIVGVAAVVLSVSLFGILGLLCSPLLLIAIGLKAQSRPLIEAGIVLGVLLILGALLVMPWGGVEGGLTDVSSQ